MDHVRTKPARREGAEVRFGLEEWLGAALAVVAILAGAALSLALTYWFVLPR